MTLQLYTLEHRWPFSRFERVPPAYAVDNQFAHVLKVLHTDIRHTSTIFLHRAFLLDSSQHGIDQLPALKRGVLDVERLVDLELVDIVLENESENGLTVFGLVKKDVEDVRLLEND